MSTTSPSSSSTRSKTACCSIVANGIKRGPWTPEEDEILANFVKKKGEGRWRTLPQQAGLQRCGKSCRLRWMNYLRPSVKRGRIGLDEEDLILRLHRLLGNRWSLIAGRIPGRTGNEIKNYWNTHLSKKLIRQGIDPRTHKPLITTNPNSHKLDHEPNTTSNPPLIPQTNSINNPAPDMGSSSQINAMKYCQNMEGHNSSTKNWPSCDYVMSQDKNICEEDTLSSFMDSLLNDNEVAGNVITASPHPITSSMQSLDLGFWEVELTSTADALGDEQFGSLFK